jgi:hypothetical protein
MVKNALLKESHANHGQNGMTAGKAVQVLEKLGVLTETTGKRRDRAFVYKHYLERLRVRTELPDR